MGEILKIEDKGADCQDQFLHSTHHTRMVPLRALDLHIAELDDLHAAALRPLVRRRGYFADGDQPPQTPRCLVQEEVCFFVVLADYY